jgi:CRISPR/Cas system CSM-associated protein Csm2 small subunit
MSTFLRKIHKDQFVAENGKKITKEIELMLLMMMVIILKMVKRRGRSGIIIIG